MPKIKSTAPAKFCSLFVPQLDWFQKLMAKTAAKHSLSEYLVDLVISDLKNRKNLSPGELAEYKLYRDQKTKIKSTRFNKARKIHSTFSLYIPAAEGYEWIREKLDADFIRETCAVKSRSLYIWDLFVQANNKLLTQAQLAEWAGEINRLNKKDEKSTAA